jgi:predicted nucleotidyltransferase
MSGNFVQRGEPAIFDKWARTVCALKCGADAVIELPLLYAVQSAEGFAAGGVAVLEAAGAYSISFGCETDDIDALTEAAEKLAYESGDYKDALKEHLQAGMSFPRARMKAAFPDENEDFTLPNAILGVEYIKAIIKNKLDIKPYAVKRVGEGYHSTNVSSPLASATAIRKAIYESSDISAFEAMPKSCANYLKLQMGKGLLPVTPDSFDKELFYILRRSGREYIKSLPDVTEGLENRIYDAAAECSTREELIARIKTKRYTYTRISRILLYALLGITKEMVAGRNSKKPDHIRVLGVKDTGVLSSLSRSSRVPVVTGSVASSLYESIDITASNIYALSQKSSPFSCIDRDYTEKLIVLYG